MTPGPEVYNTGAGGSLRLWRWRRRGQSATTSEGFGQDRDIGQTVAVRHSSLEQFQRQTKTQTITDDA